MERNWSLVFHQHPTAPTATGELEFDNGEVIRVFSGTWDEGIMYAEDFRAMNDLGERDAVECIIIADIT